MMISVRRSAGSSRGQRGSTPSSRLRSRASRMARNLRLIESLWRYGIGGTLARFECNLTRSVYLTLERLFAMSEPKDKFGRTVTVGSRVRVLDISSSFLDSLPKNEIEDVRSMIGEVFQVYEIDEYGSSWVEKVWHYPGGKSMSHSVALSQAEMELVGEKAPDRPGR